jgi:DDE superfamily endonuclease
MAVAFGEQGGPSLIGQKRYQGLQYSNPLPIGNNNVILKSYRAFHAVLRPLLHLHRGVVKLPSPEYVNPIISSDPRLFPWFKDALDAVDGSHIPAFVTNTVAQSAWRNRKGFLSQNIFAAVDFNMNFVSVLAGWESSAHDLMVYKAALEKELSVPAGKYYLADTGYKSKDSQDLLTPYLEVRYHIKEQARASCRPETPEELFNLRHAQLRNVVERTFGVLKKRFRILNSIPVGYSLRTQVRIVYALTALHNFYNLNGLDPNLEASLLMMACHTPMIPVRSRSSCTTYGEFWHMKCLRITDEYAL